MRRLLLLLVMPFASMDSATAHHAFTAAHELENEGVITAVTYKNPHAHDYL